MGIKYSVTQYGKELSKDKYTWDEDTKTFSSTENNLVLDFSGINNCTFKTGSHCSFNTLSDCTFNTLSDCTFNTGSDCTFKTSSDCTFKTGFNCSFDTWSECTFDTSYGCSFNTLSGCSFNTGSHCTFNTGSDCTFKTSSDCTFNTGYNCTFKTGYECIFKTGYECTFKTGYECVVIRREIYEIIELEENIKIKLNKYNIKGFTYIKEINNKEDTIYKEYISLPVVVYGVPMTLGDYNKHRGWTIPKNEDPNKKGYMVTYSNTEFKGWSSKERFEEEHKLLKDMGLKE